ncbi:MAG: hypothetical protein N4A33_06135 [Bacteriovoracaceae bacterium]|nr:hypothetical protein [Bacteriovoracaceae bacterium]
MKFNKNQKGFGLIFNILFIMTFSLILLYIVSNKLNVLKDTKYLSKQYLCFKEFNAKTLRHVKNIEKLNLFFDGKILLDALTIAFPILGSFTISAHNAKKLVKATQNAIDISYSKNFVSYASKGCLFVPIKGRSPFETKSFGLLKRQKISEKAIRKKEWKYGLYLKEKNMVLQSDFNLEKRFSPEVHTKGITALSLIRDYINKAVSSILH